MITKFSVNIAGNTLMVGARPCHRIDTAIDQLMLHITAQFIPQIIIFTQQIRLFGFWHSLSLLINRTILHTRDPGDKALVYLGRYLYRGVIREKDILPCRDGKVTYRYQDSKTKC